MSLTRLFSALLVILLFAASAGAVSRNLSPAESREFLLKESDAFLLDVRTAQEYREIRLEGAHLIPIDQLLKRISELPTDRPILVYCAVGSRSSQVANYLSRQGYRIYNMYGGIWGWQLRGYPVLKGGP